MTRKLIALNIRALFAKMFLKNRNQKKRNPVVTVLIALLALYVFASVMGMFGLNFYTINKPFFSMGLGWFYFCIMGLAVFGFGFISSIFAAQSQIFNAKDNELLFSLPVKPSAILTGRLASLLLLEYLFTMLIALPAFAIWVVFQPVTAVSILFFIIVILTMPLAALAFASFFAWIIALIASKLRKKNALTLIFSLLFMGLYFWVFSNLMGHMNTLVRNGREIADSVREALFPFYHLGAAIETGNFVSLLIYLICAIAPFILMVLILSANFVKIATTNRGAAKIKYTEKALKVSGVRTAFVSKELRHFFGNPMYILNSSLGGVFMLVGAVALAVKRDMVLSILEELNKTGVSLSAAALVCVILGVISALNMVSAPSISLEGKNLWIAKSLPVRAFDILMSKAETHILVCGIPAVVSALIAAIVLQVTALQFLIILLVPCLLTALSAFFGVTINLLFPRFDWINELQPIKQGISVLITMFGVFAFVAALAVLYVAVLTPYISPEIYLLLCCALFAVLIAALYGYFKKGGSRRFEALHN